MVNKGDKGNTGNTGATGVEGQGYLYAYYPSNSLTPPATPATSGTVPSGWWSSPNFNGYRYIYVSQCVKTGGSWGGWTSPTIYSVKGEDGDPGPAIVYRGDFSSGNTYYNNAARRDVVKYGSTYYIYKGSDATSGGWNSANWENFGAQFDSVATRILLAENANIGGWVIQNERLESQSGGAYLDGKTGTIDVNGSITSKGGKYTTKVANGDFTSQLDTVSSKPYLIRLNTFGGTNYIEGTLELRELDSSSGSMNNYTSLKPYELKIAGSSTNYSTGFVARVTDGQTRVHLNDLPTSTQSLQSGELWRDGNTIKIV
jgi:hypothetical protein